MAHTGPSYALLQVPINKISTRMLFVLSAGLTWDRFHAESAFETQLLLLKVCCILPIQIEGGSMLHCHLACCQLNIMKTWR